MLVDALATKGESQELADWLATTGKNLTEVYITHAHGDHFFGLNAVLDTFPEARAVALPELVPLLADQATPEWMQIWNTFFPDQLFETPAVPVALDKPELEVEGHTLHVLKLGQSDVADSTAVHVPTSTRFFPATSSTTASTPGCTSSMTRSGWTGSRR